MLFNPAQSVAQLADYTYRNTRHPEIKKRLETLVKVLPDVKKIALSKSVIQHVIESELIPTAEIIGGLTQGCFPTNRLWVEINAKDLEGSSFSSGPPVSKLAGLISADADGRGFKLSVCVVGHASHVIDKNYYKNPEEQKRPLAFWHRCYCVQDNQTIIPCFPINTESDQVNICQEKGIDLPDDIITNTIEKFERINKDDKDMTTMIDDFYRYADIFSRVFYVLGSPNIRHNISSNPSTEEASLKTINKNRARVNRPPHLPAQEVFCERTSKGKYKKPKTVQEARVLLGRTFVSRSREIRNPDGSLWLRKSDGLPWTRREHERAIKAPIDRTNLLRVVLSSNPAQLELAPQVRSSRLIQEP